MDHGHCEPGRVLSGRVAAGEGRPASTDKFERIGHPLPRLVRRQIYNLAAQSFVPMSGKQSVLTAEFPALGVAGLLDAIRLVNPGMRFYQQAPSTEMSDKVRETPQDAAEAIVRAAERDDARSPSTWGPARSCRSAIWLG